ncbi:DUF2142 domain-containing protein [Enterococcus gallinarum]|uniref:DUF2142 domain-containing protein n=1 Tax=Enterococcus gallinarum TaxID=1353 RepID=UPI003BF821C8
MSILKKNFIELKKNTKLVLLFLFILLMAQFLLQYKETIWPKTYMLIGSIAGLFLLTFSRLRNEKKIAFNAFLLIFIIGTLNAIILPVRQNLDENTHYYHALEVADGKIRNQTDEKNFIMISPDFLGITKLPSKPEYGNDINTNIYNEEFMKMESISSTYKDEWLKKSGFNNPAYLPSALGITIGRLFSNRVSIHYYMGRIFNVLFYALLAFFAIKISKRYKLALFVVATTPFAVWISSGFTYDNLYYGLVLLILAQFTNFFVAEGIIKLKKIALYMLTCFGLIFCKAPVILLAALPIFIPLKYYDKKNDKIYTVVATFLCFLCGFLWLINGKVFQVFTGTISASVSNSEGSENVLSYLLTHIEYTVTLFLRSFSDVIASIGYFLKNPQPFLMASETTGFINFIVFTVLIILSSMLVKISLPKVTVRLSLATFFVILVGTIFAITGDPRVFSLGDLRVPGVQGRYHFYLLAFLPLLLSPLINKLEFKKVDLISNRLETQITIFCMKAVYIIAFLNSCVAIYGYL